jgi:hypothetical protein
MKQQLLISSIILERFVNLHTKQEMLPYIDTIWDILQKSYAPIGGFLTASSKEDLINKTGLAKLVRKDGKIVAVKIYKDDKGRKSIAAGTDGSEEGKRWLIKMFQEDVNLGRAWGEFSGKAEHLMLKHGGVPMPNALAAQVLGKPIISLHPDGFHYTREIMGEPHEKILIGTMK